MMAGKILMLLITTQLLYAYEGPVKLILHIDINKTIIADDTSNGKSLDLVLIESLAKHYKGMWDPSLRRELTYVDYVKDHLLPGDKSNRDLRARRNKAIHAFLDVLKSMRDPRYPMILERFEKAQAKVHSQKGRIFNSFYNLINYLEKKNTNYTIVLRTFGPDGGAIAQELAANIHLLFDWEGRFFGEKLYLKSTQKDQTIVLETMEEIFSFFKSHRHIQIRDDFKYWNDHHEQAEYGKPFPVDTRELNVKTLFFDDNAQEKIINPRDIVTGGFLDPVRLIEKGSICPVDTLQAIENDDYFIDAVYAASFFNKRSET